MSICITLMERHICGMGGSEARKRQQILETDTVLCVMLRNALVGGRGSNDIR